MADDINKFAETKEYVNANQKYTKVRHTQTSIHTHALSICI